jgi:tetratricopeptide (TPR) repeat protein
LPLSQNALKRNPDSFAAWKSHRLALFGVGRFSEALDATDALIRLQPLMAEEYLWRARVLSRLGQPEAALMAAEEARSLAPEDHSKHYAYGNGLIKLNRL